MRSRIFFLSVFIALIRTAAGQKIGDFNSVQPTAQTQSFVLPPTHTFQRIIRSGNSLSSGGVLGNNLDFTGYVPISGSSTNGYLSISSETSPAECSILSVSFQADSKTWTVNSGGKVSFPFADLGNIASFCSGMVTSNGTVMICEENTSGNDANGDGYTDLGWIIEIDPVTRTVINQDGIGGVDKLWAMGRQSHENIAISSDHSVFYWGADANPTGYMYKFVPSVAGNYSSGSLYVLKTNASLGTGTWELIPNTTQPERNNTVSSSTTAGAFNFNGIEDVETGPDNKVYFAAKGPGVIYRFRDLGTSVDQLEVYVASNNYDVDGAGPFPPEPWGIGNDNLAFDQDGNLWVLQDGSRNHIWVVSPSHSVASPAIRLFATTPAGSEPTGITFTPDNNFMFISFQHPSSANTASQTDAANASVIFNTHTTVVVARKEFLGSSALPLKFVSFNGHEENNAVTLNWKVEDVTNHALFEIERSADGVNYTKIGSDNRNAVGAGGQVFHFTDAHLPASPFVYYRIRQCDKDGQCAYSTTLPLRLSSNRLAFLYPTPVTEILQVNYISSFTGNIHLRIINAVGMTVQQQMIPVKRGMNTIKVKTNHLSAGHYFLQAGESAAAAFLKSN